MSVVRPDRRLRLIERESPDLAPGTIRIAVSVCGVNFVDGLIVEGRYQIKPPVPFVPGMEVVGRVTELASTCRRSTVLRCRSAIGCSPTSASAGTPARRSCRLSQVSRVAPALSDGQAATFMQSYMTGWYALRRVGPRCGRDSRVLVLGAGSGVGLAAVDIASALGLHVIAAASTADKRALAESLGAEATIDTSALDAAGVKDAAKEFAASFGARGRRRRRPSLRPGRWRARRDLPAGPRRRRPVSGDRLRRRDPVVAGQSGAAAQPAGHRRRLGSVGQPSSRRQSGDARIDPRTDRARRSRARSSRRSTPSPTHRGRSRTSPAERWPARWRWSRDLADCSLPWWS